MWTLETQRISRGPGGALRLGRAVGLRGAAPPSGTERPRGPCAGRLRTHRPRPARACTCFLDTEGAGGLTGEGPCTQPCREALSGACAAVTRAAGTPTASPAAPHLSSSFSLGLGAHDLTHRTEESAAQRRRPIPGWFLPGLCPSAPPGPQVTARYPGRGPRAGGAGLRWAGAQAGCPLPEALWIAREPQPSRS